MRGLQLLQAARWEPPGMWQNLRPLPRLGHFLPSDVCLHTPLCLWTGLVIHWMPRFLLIALWSGSMRASKNFYVESLPTKEESRTLRAPWWCPVCSSQPTEGFKQTWASWHHGGQACMGGTPRTWVFGGPIILTHQKRLEGRSDGNDEEWAGSWISFEDQVNWVALCTKCGMWEKERNHG